jgi:hypothetical protein
MRADVYHLEPDQAPLVALLSSLGSIPAKNPKVEWLENEAMPRLTTLSASATSAATAYGVSADIFRVGDVIRLPAQGHGGLVTATAAGAITANEDRWHDAGVGPDRLGSLHRVERQRRGCDSP